MISAAPLVSIHAGSIPFVYAEHHIPSAGLNQTFDRFLYIYWEHEHCLSTR